MRLYVSSTGIRNGEFITSSPKASQNKGSVLQIFGAYPPYINYVNMLSEIELRDQFNCISFFNNMTVDQRLNYLRSVSTTTKDLYFENVDLRVKVIKLSGKFILSTFSEDNINRLIAGNSQDPDGCWRIRDLFDMFPRKPGSKGTTLLFRPTNWSLLPTPVSTVQRYSGFIFSMDPPGFIWDTRPGDNLFICDVANELDQPTSRIFQNNNIRQVAIEIPPNSDVYTIDNIITNTPQGLEIRGLLSWFSPSLHKSLLQKLVRTRCTKVIHGTSIFPSSSVFTVSFCMLVLHPGALVPDIKRFVSGVESATKRLAVIICEDSFCESGIDIMGLLVATLLSQRNRDWKPSTSLVKRWLLIGLDALRDKRTFQYDWYNFPGYIKSFNEYSLSYLLLGEVKSFHSDISMLGSISLEDGRPKSTIIAEDRDNIMPLIHCIDHHCLTDIAHFLPYSSAPYPIIFKDQIWALSSSVNPRLEKFQDYYWNYEHTEFIQTLRLAQRRLWINRSYIPQSRPVTNEIYNFTYSLDESWLSGLIGPIPLNIGSHNVVVVLKPYNIYDMIVVRKPPRGEKSEIHLSEEEKDFAINQVKNKLYQGIVIDQESSVLPMLKGVCVLLRDNIYYIRLMGKDNWETWSSFINLSYQLFIHEPMDITVDNALYYIGDGVQRNMSEDLLSIINVLPIPILTRTLTYLQGYHSEIILHKISRNGTGQDYTVKPEDSGVHEFLCKICVICPGALMINSNKFVVKNGPLIWNIRDILRSSLDQRSNSTNVNVGTWNNPTEDMKNRILWEHQREAVGSLIKKHKIGKTHSLIYITVGLGKTLILVKYIVHLIRIGKMPKYCVYTLPSSALSSIQQEFNYFNIPHTTLDMTSNGRNRNLQPYMINFIYHHHLRLNDEIKDLAGNIFFVIDEFHKLMNPTQQTSVALEVSRLCWGCVGLSGTIIKDSRSEDLISWLSLVSDYEVTENNYWTSIAGLISSRITTNISVERQDVSISMTSDQQLLYNGFVPMKLGGTSNTLNFREAVRICYDIIFDSILYYIIEYLKLGEKVFVVVKDSDTQYRLNSRLNQLGFHKIHSINKDNSISYIPGDSRDIDVIITTPNYAEGYNLTKIRIMITSVYFSNAATREQLLGRINRIGQLSNSVRILTLHTGILSYVHEKYEDVRSLSECLKEMAKEVIMENI